MPVIEIPETVFTILGEHLPTGTKINPTQIVRAALLLVKQSNLSKEQIFTLIGQSPTDLALIGALEEKND